MKAEQFLSCQLFEAGLRLMMIALLITFATGLGLTAHAQTYHVIHNFAPASGDGNGPEAGLTWDSHGNLYGTTFAGGTVGGCSGYTCGTVFEMSPNGSGGWNESVIYNFTSPDGNPDTPVSIDAQGNLYGADLGFNNDSVVYKLFHNPSGSWSKEVLHRFQGNGDGQFPEGGVTIGSSNMLYGTTLQGGQQGLGTVFSINLLGVPLESILHSFEPNLASGTNPSSTYLQEIDGNLYGTTDYGGFYQDGTVFELSPNGDGGWTATTLYEFKGHNNGDGAVPIAGLLPDGAGNFYGITAEGGTGCSVPGCETVYKLTHNANGSWSESVLYSFQGQTDGNFPWGNLIMDSAGNLYGTTYAGGVQGAEGYGTVFKLTPGSGGHWTETVLARLPGGSVVPGGLVMDSSGNLYGTAQDGGANNAGVVFEVTQ